MRYGSIGDLIIKGPVSKLGVREIESLESGDIKCFTSGDRIFDINQHLVDGEYIFMNDGGNAGTKYNHGKSNYSNHVFAFTTKQESLLPKFLYYYLKNNEALIETAYFQGVGLKNLNKGLFDNFEVPIPSLDDQDRIVQILDKFTTLEAELEAELEARKKQYIYYRNKFFEDNKDVQIFKLMNVVQLTMGTSPQGDTISENPDRGVEFHQGKSHFGNFIIGTSGKYTTDPVKIAEPESVIMSVRAPVGDSNYTDRSIAIGRGLCAMKGKKPLNTKYLYYFIDTNIDKFKQRSTGSTFESINTKDIESIDIPIPSPGEQRYIVEVLDRFTKLTHDISIGLPAEIVARKKQYEYYRNKLLTFEESES